MVEKLKEDTDPHDQLFFFELHIERCVESQGSAGMGFCVLILENMKKYLFIFMTVLFVSASFSTPALALGEFEPGGIYNPIKIKIQPRISSINFIGLEIGSLYLMGSNFSFWITIEYVRLVKLVI